MRTTDLRRGAPSTTSPSTTSPCPCSAASIPSGRRSGPSISSTGWNVQDDLGPVRAMYRHALQSLRDAQIPFAVGGAYALGVHTGIHRETKDLDIFTVPRRAPDVLALFSRVGFASQMVAPHWLGKAT